MIVYITKHALSKGILKAEFDDSCYNPINKEIFIPRKGLYLENEYFDNYEDALQNVVAQINTKIEEYKEDIEYFILNKPKLIDL